MVGKQALPSSLRILVEEVAEKVVLQLYGGAPPWGTRFEAIEAVGVEVGDAVACAVMRGAVERQAAEAPAKTCGCGHPLKEPSLEPHLLTTRRGEVGWNEPTGYCPQCRRDFFPSEPSIGASGG